MRRAESAKRKNRLRRLRGCDRWGRMEWWEVEAVGILLIWWHFSIRFGDVFSVQKASSTAWKCACSISISLPSPLRMCSGVRPVAVRNLAVGSILSSHYSSTCTNNARSDFLGP